MASGNVFNVARQLLSGVPACRAQVRFAGGEVITCQHAQHHEEDHEASFDGRRFRWSRTAEEEAMRRVALADADQADAIVRL